MGCRNKQTAFTTRVCATNYEEVETQQHCMPVEIKPLVHHLLYGVQFWSPFPEGYSRTGRDSRKVARTIIAPSQGITEQARPRLLLGKVSCEELDSSRKHKPTQRKSRSKNQMQETSQKRGFSEHQCQKSVVFV